MKKKWMSLTCTLVLGIAVLTGCMKKDTGNDSSTTNTVAPTQSAEVTVEATATPIVESTKEPTIEKMEVNVAALKGPTAMGLVQMMDLSEQGLTANDYKLTVAGTADEITAGIIKGDYPIAAVPCNLAAVLYAKSKGGIKVAGINTLSVLYIVETGESVKSVEDLRGKTIYSTGKGTTPEYTLNYILKANGIDPMKDVTIEFKSEATEVAAILSESEDAIAMLPQPYVTTVMMNNDKVKIALDVAKEWEAISENGSSVVTGVVVVNAAFAEEHKDVVDAFLNEYKESVAYANENIEDASVLIEKYDIIKKGVAMKAIPNCNIVLIQGDEMKTKINGYLEALYDQAPASVGGSMPDEKFYYEP